MVLLYRYQPLEAGILLKRYKRFLADIELASGEIITAHCPNTGPMLGVSTPGSAVQVSYHPSPVRKLAYTWEMIQVHNPEPTWVGINTSLANQIIKLLLQQKLLPELGSDYQVIRSEVPYGKQKSRIDFLLTGGDLPIYLEVKNTTLADGNLALFPDTVTTRGQKHLQELTDLLSAPSPQAKAVMLYLINRSDCTAFAPGEQYDPLYARYFHIALSKGLMVLPCRFEVTPLGVSYLGTVPVQIS